MITLQQGNMEAARFKEGVSGTLNAFSVGGRGGTAKKLLGVIFASGSTTTVSHGAHAPLTINPSVDGVLYSKVYEGPTGSPGAEHEITFGEVELTETGAVIWLAVIPLDGTLNISDRHLGFNNGENWFETRGTGYTSAPETVPMAFQSRDSEGEQPPPVTFDMMI